MLKKTLVWCSLVILLGAWGLPAVAAGSDDESPSAADEAPAKEPISKQRAPKEKVAAAGGNYSVGIGPIGNVYVIDTLPELSPGVGGYVFFDYRWSPQFSTQFGILFALQDGTGPSKGDNDIILFGVPTFDLKFYILSNPSRWDPYALIGIGFYGLSEGTQDNGTAAFGIGADMGLGTDFYITEQFSVGLSAVFRSIGMIDSLDKSNNGNALFPFSMMGNFAYHF